MVALSSDVRLPPLGHPAFARMAAIVMMVAKIFLDRTDMLTLGLTEPYCGPSIMVKEGGVPANFC